MSVATTTIKVTPEVRDRLNALAAEEGRTAGSVVERLLDEYFWRQKTELAGRQMRAMSPQDREEYMEEVRLWDTTSSDGLEPEDWSDEWSQ